MVQVWLLRWPKGGGGSATITGNGRAGGAGKTALATGTAGAGSVSCKTAGTVVDCCGIAKFIEKLKKKRKRRAMAMGQGQRRLSSSSRQSSFQCRYDPLSYSLNFDTRSGGGSLVDDDEDYCQLYSFSSRFVNNPIGIGSGSRCHPSIATQIQHN